MSIRWLIPLTALLGLAACQREAEAPAAPAAEETAAAPAEAAVPVADNPNTRLPGEHSFGPEISAEDLTQHVRVLASDEFEGRAPGGKGEELTVAYLVAQFKRLGLEPGNGESWLQQVPMVETRVTLEGPMRIGVGDETLEFAKGDDMVLVSKTGEPKVDIADSEMVFVGYGVVAPEADWNDYQGLDVKGKTVVMLVNDPGFHVGDEELFGGKRMTWYGRWAYKYEEAARQGAAAALIIHDDAGAGYGWDVVKNSWAGVEFDLPAEVDPTPRLPAQGWLTLDAAQQVFDKAGLDLAALREAANRPGFEPVPMGTRFSASMSTSQSSGQSPNVLGLLRGSEKPDEVIIYIGHWDHLGRNDEMTDDPIYNGAVDNATGVGGILEIAEAFVAGPRPKRSVLFMPVTLEESGLLGAKYYTAEPVYPLAKTVAAINLDALRGENVGPTRDMIVIGDGASELEDILRGHAEAVDRVLRGEAEPEKGFYYRSDHFNFAKAGVPALYAKAGIDALEGGEEFGMAQQQKYTSDRYHKPADEWDPSWDLRGIVSDLQLLHQVGRSLADDTSAWPNWYEGNEFRAKRDEVRAAASE